MAPSTLRPAPLEAPGLSLQRFRALWHVLDQNMTSAVAVAAPRFHDQLEPNILEMEHRHDNETVAYMISRGHNVTRVENESTDVNVVRRLPNGTF